jgi:hypothetical protein
VIPATIAIETSMFAAGVALYVTMTRPNDAIGRWSLAALVALPTVIYLANILGPPPPSATAVAATALAPWVYPVGAWWSDAHRLKKPYALSCDTSGNVWADESGLYRASVSGTNLGLPGAFAGLTPPIYGVYTAP